MKWLLSCLISLFILSTGFTVHCNTASQVMNVSDNINIQTVSNEIQVIAKRPFLKRGEIGVLALKCPPNETCNIISRYKVDGKENQCVRNLISGKDGSVLCTWTIDPKTDLGIYDIQINCGGQSLVTKYTVN